MGCPIPSLGTSWTPVLDLDPEPGLGLTQGILDFLNC